ncbi:hypothetical protein GPECTOR_12g385 [Gonium pectorale]|uniref:Fungal lipase-type domain-containing protein n=1 Tax=Gonium pectorale TaxID=33097 RepID=A0A150GNK5_GONPE|nr:hypothetical protein GPECTOR_12g385 [Gonium pectorale]|eukprot:KXZ51423.1 hypothetical protein GPECTOR_12g385 [Gonium pectorale]
MAGRPMTLTPYLTVADEVEVSFAAMLADLCNMAYEVDKLDPELLEARHRLSLIATSITCSGPGAATCAVTASASEADAAGGEGAQAVRSTERRAHIAAGSRTADHIDGAAPGIVSLTLGGSPPLSPSISMLQLTSPEAVTAALTSQGHGAAFAHPVYVSTLHHALTSLGSYDEEGDISDLEWRAAMAAAGPRALLVGGPGAAAAAGGVGPTGAAAGSSSPRGLDIGSMGTIATLDELLLAGEPVQYQAIGASDDGVGAAAADGTSAGLGATALAAIAAGMQDHRIAQAGSQLASATVATLDLISTGGAASTNAGGGRHIAPAPASSGIFFTDVNLSEERDFLTGHTYGYNTQLVQRRNSLDGTEAGGLASLPAAETTLGGAAGGRALRAEQEQITRRRSVPGDGVGGAGVGGPAGSDAAGGVEGDMVAMTGAPPVVVASAKAPPSAWFAVDDKLTKTRYFAIQGSTSLEHWQINLQFEPVVFEDPKHGVRVHRGVYEAAKTLYDDILPLIQQHLESSPYATVSFSGHSLGGSLGTVLMLLFVVRGVLKPANISPVYTFGAPAIFCQGAVPNAPPDRCANCNLSCHMRNGVGATADGRAAVASGAAGPLAGLAATAASMEQEQVLPLGLLASLGLSEDQVVNVIMHKDIVPRAFVCDYTAVAGVLHRWWPSLVELQGAKGTPHKSLYNFVGRVAVVRPTPDLPFVNGPSDASHPMLPNHPALYRVGLHDEHALPLMDHAAASLASWDELLMEGLQAMSAIAGACRRFNAAAQAKRAAKLASMQRTVLDFMNQPHPLTTLGDYQAYGPNGCISRFHNPDNYTRALNALKTR